METIIAQLKGNKEQLLAVKDGKRLALKAAGNILAANFTGSTTTHVDPELLDFVPIANGNSQSVLDYFPKVMCDSHSVVTVRQASDDDDGTFGSVSEGAAKEKVDFDITSTQKSFTKYAAYVKVSEEMLSDIPFLNAAINSTLTRRIKNKIATDFLAAIVAATPGGTASTLASGSNIGAGEFGKVFAAVYSAMRIKKGYSMNLWLLNDPDYTDVFTVLGDSAWLLLNTPTIVPAASVTAGSIVAMDTQLLPLYVYKDVDIEIGRDSDDFTKNLVTVRGEARVTWDITGESLSALFRDTLANIATQA